MTQNNRKFLGSISIKIGTKRSKFELSPAHLHGGAEGSYRVRLDRRWLDAADGSCLFFGAEALAIFLAQFLEGKALTPRPEFKKGQAISFIDDLGTNNHTFVFCEPVLLHDGQWYVGTVLVNKGFTFIAADKVRLRSRGSYESRI